MYRNMVFAISLILYINISHSASAISVMVDRHAEITTANAQSISIGFDLIDLENHAVVENNETFDLYRIPGEGFTYEYGQLQLPSVSRMVVVPPQKGLDFVVRASEPRRIKTDNQPLLCTDETAKLSIGMIQSIQSEVYPPVIAEMSEPFIMRGVRMVRVTTYPVRYDPQDGVYLHYDHVETEIRLTNEEPLNPVYQPVRRNRSQEFLKFMRSFAINGDIVGRDDPDRDSDPEYVGHYLIVTHENCLQYVAPFIEWRRKSGWKVDILSLSSGDANNPRRVQTYIRERYSHYVEEGIDPFDLVMLIGDHSDYGGLSPGQQWVLASDAGSSSWPHNCNHNDYYYTELEGNDHYAEVGIARWIAGSQRTLELFSERTLSYEVEPYMENTDWFTRGFVYAQNWGGNYHISLATNVRWGKMVLESLGFDDVTTYENMDSRDSNGQMIGPHIRDAFNDGTNVMIGRAENYYWRQNISGMDNREIFPIDLDIGGHHEWTCWNMLRMPANDRTKGPVAASTGWGGQQTLPYSIIWLESVNGFLQHDMTFGWAHIKGVLSPETYIPNQGFWTQCRTDVVFYGDPGIQYWRGVPQEVDLEFSETITPTDKLVEIYVMDAVEETDLAGAQVTIYVPGDMPDFDEDDYADFGDMFMLTKKTDARGNAVFVIPEDVQFEEGTMYITVTGRDILPNLNEIEIEEGYEGVELADWSLDQIEGNDDGNVNPGEVFSLNLIAHNISEDNDLEDVTATITSLSPDVGISDDNTVDFGGIETDGFAEGDEGVIITISASCPDAASRPVTQPSLQIVLNADDSEWKTAILLDPVAPNFIVNRVIGGNVIADSIDFVNPEIKNIGRMPSPEVNATLVSLGMGVSVVEPEAEYPELDPEESSRIEGDGFRVAGNRVVVPGSVYDVVVILQTEAGFVDSAFFQLQVSEERENAPQGPDGYGYICFDDTDTDWDITPEYDWVEISLLDRNRDFDGEELDFEGRSPHDIGESLVIDLPFETQFYGILYDQITVATNGFISMGDQEWVTNYQNWPMDRCIGGGVGMMAPLWDDLRLPDGGGVYSFYDEEDSRIIVEWYKMRHRSGGNSDLTFQVILYDNDVWITETGDQNILFQYKEVSNVSGRPGWANASPFASVGISSPEGTTGINYTFNNQYPVTSARLENRRALLFATSPRYRSGVLFGRIIDAGDSSAIEGAIVSTLHGFTAISDENGDWRINDALAEIEFSISCFKPGYNDSTKYELIVEEDGELEINFNLLHPEFTPSTLRLSYIMDPELTINLPFSIENSGNGPLDWALARRLPGNADVDPWVHRLSYYVTETTGDTRIEGLVFIDSRFYLSGANIVGRADSANMIWVLDSEGALLDSFPQLGTGTYGMRDLAWDGELIWGSGEQRVFGFTTEGDSSISFEGPFNPNTALAWDLHREVLWVARKTGSDIYAYTREGECIDSLTLDQKRFRIYGLAYWQDDPDHYSLYILHSPDNRAQMLYKMNPVNGDTMFVTLMEPEGGGAPGGAFATNQYDVYSWVFMNVANDNNGDRIDIWQIDARRDWFRVFSEINDNRTEIYSGRIDAQVMQDFELQLSSVDLPDTTFIGMLTFGHNAEGGETIINVDLEVIGPMRPTEFDLLYPEDASTVHANQSYDSTMVVFTWAPSFDYNQEEDVSYQALFKSGDESVYIECDVCSLMVEMQTLIDDLGLPVDAEFQLEWWVFALSGEDARESNDRFELRFEPHGLDDDAELPVEFGLRSIYPSPFNAMTTVRFGADRNERISLRVYDLQGRLTATLWDRVTDRGYHHVVWDAALMPSGLYIVRLEATGRMQTAKVALMR